MSVAGIMGGTEVEVAGVDRMSDGDLLVGLITNIPTWVCMHAGDEADELERLFASVYSRVCVPMPPRSCLMFDKPDVVTDNQGQESPS